MLSIFPLRKTLCLTKVIIIQGAFKNIQGLFKDIPQFFNFQGLFKDMIHFQGIFKACANHGLTGSYTEDEPNLVRKKTSRGQHHLQ